MNDWYVWQREYSFVDEQQVYLIDTGSLEVADWLKSQGAEQRAGTSYSSLWAIPEPIYMLLCLRYPRRESYAQQWVSDADC
jgi:hypothetical protein